MLVLLPLSGSASARVESFPAGLIVSVGYADNLRVSGFFPTPWRGDTGVIFEGCTSCTIDAGAVELTNTTASAITVNSLQVEISSCTTAIWPANVSLPAGGTVIYTQETGNPPAGCPSNPGFDFDTSDDFAGTCASPNSIVPEVDVTANGTQQAFFDTQQVLNTGGVDLAACPSGTNESQPWTQIGGPITPDQHDGGSNPSEPQFNGCSVVVPVDCATGNFWHTFNELLIPGRGVPLQFTLTYNSLGASQNSPVGYGWSFTYGAHLVIDAGTGNVTVAQENGSTVPFTNAGGGAFQAPSYAAASLVQNGDGSYTFTRRHDGETFTFSSAGVLQSIADRNGYQTTLAYNGSGQLTTATDPANRTLSFSYWPSGQIEDVSDPGGRTVSLAYTNGDLTSITDTNTPTRGETSFTYQGSSHLLLTMTDPRNDGSWVNVYNAAGQVTSQTDPLNRNTTFSYLAGTTTITSPAPNSNVTREHFSDFLPVAVTRGYGTSSEATWTYQYDPVTLCQTLVTDPNGNKTQSSCDADGDLTSVTDPLNRQTTAAYNQFDEPLTVTDPRGTCTGCTAADYTTTRTYDAHGNLLSVSRPLAGSGSTQTVAYHYDDPQHPGDVTSITDPRNHTSTLGYDGQGDLTSITDPLGDKTTFAYSTLGQLTSTVGPRGNVPGADPNQYTTSYQYTGLGLLKQTTDPLSHTTINGYDGDGNLVSSTDGGTNPTSYTYDADNELTKITRADNTTLQYGHDGDGNQTTQTDGSNKTTSYAYDPLDRVKAVTDPLSRTTSYSYDGAGNLLTRKDPSNRTMTYGYDAANELTSISYSDGTTPNVSSITYYLNGQRHTMVDGTGTTTYNYDSLNRLTSQTNGANQQVAYGYDLNNNLTSLAYPGNHTVTRVYDNANRLTSITDWLTHTTTFTQDPDSNTTNIAYPNGVDAAATFDHADQPSSITDTGPGNTALASFTYTRDGNNQVTSEAPTGTDQGSTQSYGYNALNKLTSVNTATYSYDAADNVTHLINGASSSYDDGNEATSYTLPIGFTQTFRYDQQGNRVNGLMGDTTPVGYDYDQANRLVTARAAGPMSVTAGSYDAFAVGLDGALRGWGAGFSGELGNGSTANSTTPVGARNVSGVVAAAPGGDFTLALKSDGTVRSWGDNGFDELGDGQQGGSSLTPVQVSNLTGVVAVAAGTSHGLALKSDGTVWAWGRNANGQLGNGTPGDKATPVQASGLTNVIAIDAGGNDSLALKSDGTVWAWGYNADGELGNGTTTGSSTPVQVSNLTGVTAIAMASDHALALKSDGTVWAWGYNGRGALGNGTTTSSSTPVQVSNLTGVTAIDGGGDISAALKPNGTVWTWGANEYGQLGNGTSTDSSTPVQVSNLTNAASITTGSHFMVALKRDGTLSSWGNNGYGQLGNGTTTDSTTPTQTSPLLAITSYTYDGDGLRTTATTGNTTLHFAWDLSASVPLLLTDGSTSYIYDDQGVPVEQVDSSNNALYYQHDQLGSTRLLTNSSGASAATYTYDPYGNLTSQAGSTDTPLRWAGQYQDTQTGLYYLRARYYDPQTAQFLTRDPMVSRTQAAYGYATQNPLNRTDPSGLVSPELFCIYLCITAGAEIFQQLYLHACSACLAEPKPTNPACFKCARGVVLVTAFVNQCIKNCGTPGTGPVEVPKPQTQLPRLKPNSELLAPGSFLRLSPFGATRVLQSIPSLQLGVATGLVRTAGVFTRAAQCA